MTRRTSSVPLLSIFLLLVPALVDAQVMGTMTWDRTTWVMQDTKYKRLDTGFPILNIGTQPADVIVTYQEQLTGSTPVDLTSGGTPKGRLDYTLHCNNATGNRVVAEGTAKVDRNGNAAFSERVMQQYECNSVWAELNRRGGYTVPAGTGVQSRFNVTKDHGTDCTPSAETLCLQGGRFQVETTWDDGSKRGPGHVLPGGDDAGTFYFFNPDNTELLVKVLNGCDSPFDSFWVFAAAATNVEYTLRVTDTQTGQMKTYFNPLGTPADPVLDTSAFATCP